MLVEVRPRRNDGEECEDGAAETNVDDLVDVLFDESDEEGECADEGQQSVCEVFGESLTFKVLIEASCQLEGQFNSQ